MEITAKILVRKNNPGSSVPYCITGFIFNPLDIKDEVMVTMKINIEGTAIISTEPLIDIGSPEDFLGGSGTSASSWKTNKNKIIK